MIFLKNTVFASGNMGPKITDRISISTPVRMLQEMALGLREALNRRATSRFLVVPQTGTPRNDVPATFFSSATADSSK